MPRRREAEPGPTAAAALAATLRQRILAGAPAPGSPLREEDLALQHGVSRHTVRTALAALTAERLVETAPYRGARVAALDDDELVALQQLRGALETEAVRLLTEAHGNGWPDAAVAPALQVLERLAAAERAGDPAAVLQEHAAFHRALVAAAGGPRITAAYAALDSEILLLLAHARPHYPAGSLAPDHRAYLDDVRLRGGVAVREHLDRSTALIRAARLPS